MAKALSFTESLYAVVGQLFGKKEETKGRVIDTADGMKDFAALINGR